MIPSATERPLSLDHLRRLTDCFGILQHANYALPDYRTGYTTDDNARALVVAVKHHRLHGDELSRELASRYLAFLLYAQMSDGRFHNFVGYERKRLDEAGSEDCFGRAIRWSSCVRRHSEAMSFAWWVMMDGTVRRRKSRPYTTSSQSTRL